QVVGGEAGVGRRRRVQGERGAVLADDNRVGRGADGTASRLGDDTGGQQGVRKGAGGAVQAGRLGAVQLNQAVVDAQAGQGGEDVLDERDLFGGAAEGGAAGRGGGGLGPGREAAPRAPVGAGGGPAG